MRLRRVAHPSVPGKITGEDVMAVAKKEAQPWPILKTQYSAAAHVT
jgi:hypothetical protein